MITRGRAPNKFSALVADEVVDVVEDVDPVLKCCDRLCCIRPTRAEGRGRASLHIRLRAAVPPPKRVDCVAVDSRGISGAVSSPLEELVWNEP